MTYGQLIRASFAIGSPLRRKTSRGETVGVMLPTGIGPRSSRSSRLHSAGRLPAMLNFTAGAASLVSAARTAKITKVVTARKFIELGSLRRTSSRA